MSAAVTLAEMPIDPAALLAEFSADLGGAGAVVSFTGHARPLGQDGGPVAALTLHSYRGMTLRSMEAIAQDAAERFAMTRCRVAHRAGTVLPGEAIVFVAVAATHRRAAFDAADYLMDRLKTEAVFWKHEDGPTGRRWIEPGEDDRRDAARWIAEDGAG